MLAAPVVASASKTDNINNTVLFIIVVGTIFQIELFSWKASLVILYRVYG